MMAQITWMVLNTVLIVKQIEKDHTKITELLMGLAVMNLILLWGGFFNPKF